MSNKIYGISEDGINLREIEVPDLSGYYTKVEMQNSLNVLSNEMRQRIEHTYPLGKDGYHKWTVEMDESKSDPEMMCTYKDNSLAFSPGSSGWDSAFNIYPCLFKNGQEVVRLDPNDFDKDINGNTVDLTGPQGDAMICFPRMGYKMSRDGSIVTISMTDHPNDSDYCYLAHTRGTQERDRFYLGVYKGWYDNTSLRSVKGKAPSNNATIGTFRTRARANGAGYEQSGWHQLVFRQFMYVLKYKNLNSQTRIAQGNVSADNAINTGGSEAYGMDMEIIRITNPTATTATSGYHCKLFGIEDFWGNIWEWIDGFVTDANLYPKITLDNDFNDAGTDYELQPYKFPSMSQTSFKSIMGDSKTGFTPLQTGGSTSTYYSDQCWSNTNRVLGFGGRWTYGSACGAFCLTAGTTASDASSNYGARLMFL